MSDDGRDEPTHEPEPKPVNQNNSIPWWYWLIVVIIVIICICIYFVSKLKNETNDNDTKLPPIWERTNILQPGMIENRNRSLIDRLEDVQYSSFLSKNRKKF
jgi:hypothetical protein